MTKKMFVLLWPVGLAIGALGIFKLCFWLIVPGDISQLVDIYAFYFFTGPYASYIYTVFSFSMLLFSMLYWFIRPSIKSLACTIFTAWILCGFPPIYIIFISTWSGFCGG